MCLGTTYLQCLRRPRTPRAGVTDCSEPPWGCSELNPIPLEEQLLLLSAEHSSLISLALKVLVLYVQSHTFSFLTKLARIFLNFLDRNNGKKNTTTDAVLKKMA